jgi:hypothetical protein
VKGSREKDGMGVALEGTGKEGDGVRVGDGGGGGKDR